MLSFTPEVESAIRWFHSTHELVNADGRFWYRRTSFPAPGGVSEQDAWLFEALELLRNVYDDMVRPKLKRKTEQTNG